MSELTITEIHDSRVVRRFGSDKTHIMRVSVGIPRRVFGADYFEPIGDERAACGVRIVDGVIMQPGSKTRCRACVHLTGITEQPGPAA